MSEADRRREAQAYEYFKRRFISEISWCSTNSDFITALFQLGVSCDDIKDKSPADAFKHVRTIVNGYAIDAGTSKKRLALFNEALD